MRNEFSLTPARLATIRSLTEQQFSERFAGYVTHAWATGMWDTVGFTVISDLINVHRMGAARRYQTGVYTNALFALLANARANTELPRQCISLAKAFLLLGVDPSGRNGEGRSALRIAQEASNSLIALLELLPLDYEPVMQLENPEELLNALISILTDQTTPWINDARFIQLEQRSEYFCQMPAISPGQQSALMQSLIHDILNYTGDSNGYRDRLKVKLTILQQLSCSNGRAVINVDELRQSVTSLVRTESNQDGGVSGRIYTFHCELLQIESQLADQPVFDPEAGGGDTSVIYARRQATRMVAKSDKNSSKASPAPGPDATVAVVIKKKRPATDQGKNGSKKNQKLPKNTDKFKSPAVSRAAAFGNPTTGKNRKHPATEGTNESTADDLVFRIKHG